MNETDNGRAMTEDDLPADAESEAAAWFLRQQQRGLTPEEQTEFERWLAASADHAAAWRDTEATWEGFGNYGTLPEVIVAREHALASVRRTQVKRWARPAGSARRGFFGTLRRPGAIAAAVVIAVLVFGAVWRWDASRGVLYTTGIGEQRTVLLTDSSRVILDSLTRVRVRYSGAARDLELVEGQAQFDVAQARNRPFRVRAGSRVIEALGTSFTVTYLNRQVNVALLEGSVKVQSLSKTKPDRVGQSGAAASLSGAVLKPGEALRVSASGKQEVREHADLAAATAWRQGKVIFREEPLSNAVEHLNRYSHVRLEVVDPAIEHLPVSGIFGVGDAEAFAEALASYFPIQAHRAKGDTIELRGWQ